MKLLLVAMLALAPSAAWAYSDTGTFALDPSADPAGGGGGLYFTGAPRQHGLNCVACHIDGPTGTALQLSALLDGAEATLFDRGYEPGKTYEIEVAFDGTDLAPEKGCSDQPEEPCDLNLFALEVEGPDGKSAGAFCPVEPRSGSSDDACGACAALRARGTRAESDCQVILADGFDEVAMRWRNGVTAYSFFWTAPATDVGPVFLYVSAVDGRGQETPDGEVTSYEHDGVVNLVVPLRSPTRAYEEPTGCSASGGRPNEVVALLALWLLARRRELRLRLGAR